MDTDWHLINIFARQQILVETDWHFCQLRNIPTCPGTLQVILLLADNMVSSDVLQMTFLSHSLRLGIHGVGIVAYLLIGTALKV